MIFTRKIGKLVRGNTTPFQIYAAGLLGAMIGFTPGFDHAPGLILFWLFLLLILNANLFLAGLVGLLSKLVFLVTVPVAFGIGRLLLEGPTKGLFETLHNAPVIAYFGLDYYVVPGGQLIGLLVGLAFGFGVSKALTIYRTRMSQKEAVSERKGWIKVLEWIFVGKKSGKSYDDLLALRMGNPIRTVGAIVVVLAVVVIMIAARFLTDGLIASMARTGLAAANGATVDLESAHLDLNEGRLELVNVAFADPNNLGTDIFRSQKIVADISGADILRKRFSIDKLVVDSASSGVPRENAGELVGPRSKPAKLPDLEMPDFKDLDSLMENAEVWKERLTQMKRWMERISSVTKPDVLKTPQQWNEELSSRIRTMGRANVKANDLTNDSPLVWLKNLEALGVKTEQLDGMLIDVEATDLSTHPHLVESSPALSIRSKDGNLVAQLSLGLAAGKDENLLNFAYKGIATSSLAETIQAEGKPLLEGGLIDLTITGDLNAVDSDLVARAKFKDVKLLIAGSQTNLDGMEMPIEIRGPIDSPRIKVDADFLKDALKNAGKQKMLEEASKELGVDLGDDTSSEGLKKAAGDLLGGFLKKNSENN
jgi:uncharacterized protein (TIGR03546 family)